MLKIPVFVLDTLAGKFRIVGTRPFTHCVVCRCGTPACFIWARSAPTTEPEANENASEICLTAGGVAYSVNYTLSLIMGLPRLYDHAIIGLFDEEVLEGEQVISE